MSSPKFLSKEALLRLHSKSIDRYGGSHGVRDHGLLDSALAQPEAGFAGQFFHQDIFEMAAAYLYHLVQNHTFNDGNKRIGLLASATFLEVNEYELTATSDDFESLVMETAQSRRKKSEIVQFFRENTEALEKKSP